MDSFELDIGEQSRVSSDFLDRVVNEFQRAVSIEREARKVTQQSIADKIGTSRAVINRQVQGLENISARRIAELFWAIGWEPFFEARKIPVESNYFTPAKTDAWPNQAVPVGAYQPLTKLGSNVEAHEIRSK